MLRLASSSPRRIALVRALAIDAEIVAADLDETKFASPATAKAEAVARKDHVTIAADTQLECEGDRVNKPTDPGDAVTMLADLVSRGTHDARTEVAVIDAAGRRQRFAVRTRVQMGRASLREIEHYVSTGEPLDKAGGYAIQGEGARLVESLEGCYANITGLPLCHVYFALRRAGVVTRERPEVVCQRHFDFVCPVWRIAQRQGRALRADGEYRSWRDEVG
ncbi:MAG TPA: Maf family protein [Candidatus Acidoferrales bacterium]|nr:Maf family protein [Candidatus Acidoferrales bacterium]